MTADTQEPGESVGEVRDAIALMDKLEDIHFGEPVAAGLIEQAEDALGFRLPASLRLFIQEVGTVSIAGKEILGLQGASFSREHAVNIVGATLLERPEGLPDRAVVVHNPGYGTRWIIDLAEGGIVREWVPHSGERGPEKHPHFGRFLLEVASDAEGEEKGAKFAERRRAQLARLKGAE